MPYIVHRNSDNVVVYVSDTDPSSDFDSNYTVKDSSFTGIPTNDERINRWEYFSDDNYSQVTNKTREKSRKISRTEDVSGDFLMDFKGKRHFSSNPVLTGNTTIKTPNKCEPTINVYMFIEADSSNVGDVTIGWDPAWETVAGLPTALSPGDILIVTFIQNDGLFYQRSYTEH